MTAQRSKHTAMSVGLGIGIVLVQVFDIAVHVGTNQIEPIRIASNLVVLVWTAAVMAGRINTRFALTAGGTILVYLAFNILFLLREGLTNPNQGGALRVTLFVLVGVTVGLSTLLASRRSAPDG